MAERTKIEWTDATVNFWWGCTKVGPGCDHCYAEAVDRRYGSSHWGQGVDRRKIKGATALIQRLNADHSKWDAAHAYGLLPVDCGLHRRVFIQSMSDLFDLDVDLDWFEEGWRLIEACDRLDIQIVTKRVSAVAKRLAAIGRTIWPSHTGLMITVVNQEEAYRDVPRLIALKRGFNIPWVGLSIEPMLGSIVLTPWLADLDWIITGGESGSHARGAVRSGFRSVRDQCATFGVAYLHKQNGEFIDADEWMLHLTRGGANQAYGIDYNPAFPLNFAEAERLAAYAGFPFEHQSDGSTLIRVGKRYAGRLLYGVEHNAFPETRR